VKDVHRVDGAIRQAGTTKLRGRVDAGFAAPARARLEGIAPFGKPVFVLVADDGKGHARCSRATAASCGTRRPIRIVESASRRAARATRCRKPSLAGCGFPPAPLRGRAQRFSNGWVSGSDRAARPQDAAVAREHERALPVISQRTKHRLPNGAMPSSRARAGAAKPASTRPRSFVVPALPDSAIDAVNVFTPRHDAVACSYAAG